MTTVYPGALDSLSNPGPTDALNSGTVPHSSQHANANDAIEAIEAELGTNPKGTYASVGSRLDSHGAQFTQFAAADSVLNNLPARVHPAESLLKQAVLWLDAAHSSASGQTVTNLGWGGSALNASIGSNGSAADSNDPKFLDWSGTNYVYLPGVNGNYLSVPSAGTTWPTGDIDIRTYVALDSYSGAYRSLVVKDDGSTNRSFVLGLSSGGNLQFEWWESGGTYRYQLSTVATGIAGGTGKWLRAVLDVDNGAAQYAVLFYLSDDGVTWTQLGSTVTGATGVTSVRSSSASLTVGSDGAGGYTATGKVFRAQILNGINGTPVLDVDTSLVNGSATSFQALTGATVTVNRSTSGRKTACVTHPVFLFGSDDYMEVADNDLIDFGATDSFTVFSVTRRWGTVSASMMIASKAAGFGSAGYYHYHGDTGVTVTMVSDGTSSHYPVTGAVTLGAIDAVASVRDKTAGNVKTYLNATAGTPITDTTGSLSNASVLRIGRTSAGTTYYADMEFIAAAVFRRVVSLRASTTSSR